MEATPPPGLVWIDAYVDNCVFTGEPLSTREASVELVGTGEPPDLMGMGWSEGAQCWYCLLIDLMEWCEEAGVSPAEAGPFIVDGAEQETVVHLTAGDTTVPWETFALHLGEAVERAQEPPPSESDVRALPELPEAWQLAVVETGYADRDGHLAPIQAAVVTDAGGQPRHVMVQDGPFSAEQLSAAVRAATRVPPGTALTSARPRAVLVEDPEVAGHLAPLLEPAGIAVRQGATPLAREAADDLQAFGVETDPLLPPLLDGIGDETVVAYLAAAHRFYAAAPWDRLRGNSFIAVQDPDEGADAPWLYVNVMGQIGEQPGLSVFTDWLDACSLAHAGRRVPPGILGEIMGHLMAPEPPPPVHAHGITLFPLAALDPDDARRLEALGAEPTFRGAFALPTHVSADDGMERSDIPLELYTVIMRAVIDTLEQRKAEQVTSIKGTLRGVGYRLTMRYPATGAEGIDRGLGDVRLTIVGHSEVSIESIQPGETLIIEGPADARAHQIAKAIEKTLGAEGRWGYVSAFELDGAPMWRARSYASDPSPTLDHFLTARSATLQMAYDAYAIHATRLPPGSAPKLTGRIE